MYNRIGSQESTLTEITAVLDRGNGEGAECLSSTPKHSCSAATGWWDQTKVPPVHKGTSKDLENRQYLIASVVLGLLIGGVMYGMVSHAPALWPWFTIIALAIGAGFGVVALVHIGLALHCRFLRQLERHNELISPAMVAGFRDQVRENSLLREERDAALLREEELRIALATVSIRISDEQLFREKLEEELTYARKEIARLGRREKVSKTEFADAAGYLVPAAGALPENDESPFSTPSFLEEVTPEGLAADDFGDPTELAPTLVIPTSTFPN